MTLNNLSGDRERLLYLGLVRFDTEFLPLDRDLDLDRDGDLDLDLVDLPRLGSLGERDSDRKTMTSTSSICAARLLELRLRRLVDGETLSRPSDELDILETESRLFRCSILRESTFVRFGGLTTAGEGSRFFGSKFVVTR